MCDDGWDDYDWDDYESGPYCMHWSIAWECEEMCVCDHECCQHSYGGECNVEGCKCTKFVDKKSD